MFVNSITYRVAPVAFGTTEHNEAQLTPAKFTQGRHSLAPEHWRSTCPHSKFSVDVRKLPTMRKAVKKMITLPADLAAQAEAIAHDENKSFDSVV